MRRALLALMVLAALVSLGSCGATKNPTTGIYGIAVTNHGGVMSGSETPSPLPRGFGLSLLEPDRGASVWVRAEVDNRAGKLVARVTADSNGVFRIPLPPGCYVVRGQEGYFRKLVTVRNGALTRVIVQTAVRF